MVQTLIKEITLEEFLQQPETKPPQEFFDNKIYRKPMPQGQHSTIQAEIVTVINTFTKKQKIAWAFPELRCTFSDKSIVPDVAVFTWENLPVNEDGTIANKFMLPPDWIIEILSPDQSMTIVTKKILHCLHHGSELGWIIDPNEKTIFTYTGNNLPQYFEEEKDLINVPCFAKDLQLTLGQIFDWLKVK
jgi:Uma2 family endonuclease